VRPTHWQTVLGLIAVAAGFGWVLPDNAYGNLQTLPAYAPVTAVFIAVFELALARIVHRKLRHVGPSKPMHPMQIARAAALAKASSATGALLVGFYGGFFLWALQRTEVRAIAHDARVAAISAVAAALLLVAALLLERACRAPRPRDEMRA